MTACTSQHSLCNMSAWMMHYPAAGNSDNIINLCQAVPSTMQQQRKQSLSVTLHLVSTCALNTKTSCVCMLTIHWSMCNALSGQISPGLFWQSVLVRPSLLFAVEQQSEGCGHHVSTLFCDQNYHITWCYAWAAVFAQAFWANLDCLALLNSWHLLWQPCVTMKLHEADLEAL